MNKITKIFFRFIFLTVIVMLFLGFIVRKSINETLLSYVNDNSNKYNISCDYKTNLNNYNSIDINSKNSDLIIRGTLTGEYRVVYGSILYEIKVDKYYKGTGDELIYVYDNVVLMGDKEGYISISDGNLPLKENNSYILFLKQNEFKNEFKHIDNQNSSYSIVDNFLGKLPVNITKDSFAINQLDRSKSHYYSEIVNNKQVFLNNDMLQIYLKEREKALNIYN